MFKSRQRKLLRLKRKRTPEGLVPSEEHANRISDQEFFNKWNLGSYSKMN